ncbi:MAG: hypothetical protein ACI92A_002151, partial [Candidatus Paceibacteria bacterium]
VFSAKLSYNKLNLVLTAPAAHWGGRLNDPFGTG